MYQTGILCKMSFDMIGEMTAGNLVDYIVSYTKQQERIYSQNDKKKTKVRKARQADFDMF